MEEHRPRRRYIEDISHRPSRFNGGMPSRKLNSHSFDRTKSRPGTSLSHGVNLDKKYSQLSSSSDKIASNMSNYIPGGQSGSMLNKTLPNTTYGSRIAGTTSRGGETKKKRLRWFRRHKITSTILIILVIILGLGGYFGSRIIGDLDKVFHGNIFSDISAIFSTTRLKGEAQGRVNILLAGYQGTNSDEGALTDSIMVVSVDTKNNTAFMFSIPRDLLVNIPGQGYQKINAANSNSNFSQPGYFNGGMGQLQQIIEQDFNIPIDYYALINYKAFEEAVNAVGGITVNIQSPDPRGLYDPNVDKAHGGPVNLPNGPVTLNGLQALALALARGDSPYAYGFPKSDINREQHQRQELVALESKAISAGVLANPIRIASLFDAIGNNVSTDLSLADAKRLAQLIKPVKLSSIQSYGLSYGNSSSDLLTTYYSPTAGDSLIPKAGINNYSQIQSFYQSITTNSSPK